MKILVKHKFIGLAHPKMIINVRLTKLFYGLWKRKRNIKHLVVKTCNKCKWNDLTVKIRPNLTAKKDESKWNALKHNQSIWWSPINGIEQANKICWNDYTKSLAKHSMK